MNSDVRPIRVAILAYPEVTASVLYGLYDLFMSAGRDWGVVVDGTPGPSLMAPQIESRLREPFTVANGVQDTPQVALDDCELPDIVGVPEIAVAPGAPVDSFATEVAWLRQCHAAGATIATACSGAMVLAQTGLLDGHDATTHWAYCEVEAVAVHRLAAQQFHARVEVGDALAECIQRRGQ